jgi:branched-chain amino acid transport system substrate-binding protein
MVLAVVPVTQAAADPAVRVGVAIPCAGPGAASGDMIAKGLRLWEKTVNAKGGILGRPVELVLLDDHEDPAMAATEYERLLAGKQADLVIGPLGKPMASACLPVLAKAGMPCLLWGFLPDSLWAANPGLAFGLLPPLCETPMAFLEMAAQARLKRFATLGLNLPKGQTVLESSAKWIKRYGGDVAMQAETAGPDLPSILERMKNQDVDGILAWGYPDGCLRLVQALRTMKLKLRALDVLALDAPEAFYQSLGQEADGVFTTVAWDASVAKAYPGGREFAAAFRSAYGQEPDQFAAQAFAAGQLLEAAGAKAQSFDRGKIRQALADLDVQTIIGHYGVDQAGRQIRQTPLTIQWQNGQWRVVWPRDIGTASPVFGK